MSLGGGVWRALESNVSVRWGSVGSLVWGKSRSTREAGGLVGLDGAAAGLQWFDGDLVGSN